VIIAVVIAGISLIIWMIRKDHRDRKEFEKEL